MSPQVYRLVVNGELGRRYASPFEGMTVAAAGGKTEITGAIIDQSHLQGMLDRVSSLGLTLYSVTPLEHGNGESGAHRAPPAGS